LCPGCAEQGRYPSTGRKFRVEYKLVVANVVAMRLACGDGVVEQVIGLPVGSYLTAPQRRYIAQTPVVVEALFL